jgi:hypothetical protein
MLLHVTLESASRTEKKEKHKKAEEKEKEGTSR